MRIGVQGEGHELYYYRLEIGFVQPDSQTKTRPRITDAYFEIRDLPWLGVLRFGQFREPISVERSTSGNDLTFLERGLPQAFNPARRLGVMAFDHSANEKWYWWNGLFAQNSTAFGEQFGDAPRSCLGGPRGLAALVRQAVGRPLLAATRRFVFVSKHPRSNQKILVDAGSEIAVWRRVGDPQLRQHRQSLDERLSDPASAKRLRCWGRYLFRPSTMACSSTNPGSRPRSCTAPTLSSATF